MNMRWIIGFTLIISILSAVAALGWADSDLINPITSQAEVERMNAETRHLEIMNQLEEQRAAAKTEAEIARIRHEQGLEEARYQAELARIAADQAYGERMRQIKIAFFEKFLTAVLILFSMAGVSMIILSAKWAWNRLSASAAVHPPLFPAANQCSPSSNGHKLERINARQREILERYIALQRVRANQNGKHAGLP